MYVKEELRSLGASWSGFLCRVCLSISEMNSVAEQPNLEMLILTSSGEGWPCIPPGTALTPGLDPAQLIKALVMLHYQFKELSALIQNTFSFALS